MPETVSAAAPVAAAVPLPRWDLSHLYPGITSSAFAQAFDNLARELADLKALFDTENIAARSAEAVDDAVVRSYETVTRRYDALLTELRTIGTYIRVHIAVDSRDAAAQARMSELQGLMVTLSLLGTRYTAFLGSLDAEALIAASPLAREYAFFVREAKVAARHLMSPAEESLSAELYPSAGAAWAKLHGDLTSQMAVPFARGADDAPEPLPMSALRALATNPDRDVRQRAYEAELRAWKSAALPLAAALNSIKHEAGVLAKRRGWSSPLEASLFGNRIDRETLDAMLGAARESFPDFRRYLRAKARLISGAERLPWYDLFAPVGGGSGGATAGAYSWDRAEAFVAEQFGTYSDKMRAFAERAFRERWVDAEPRVGKRDGAFCTSIRADESLILQNYEPSVNGVATLAHELGHAYHNLCLADRPALLRGTPMTLAETASIFCETIVKRAALARTDTPGETLAILEASLQGACQVVVDITSRFLFEQRVIEKRAERELSVEELCGLMLEAQRETYGDGLQDDALHPYMWAVKNHYYGRSFYNYPYMFGLLFGLGLFAHYRRDPDAFRERYDDLLSRTGMADAAELASDFAIDLRDGAFWRSSLDVLREDIRQFEALAASAAEAGA